MHGPLNVKLTSIVRILHSQLDVISRLQINFMECFPLENETSKLSQNVWRQSPPSDTMLHPRRAETSNALLQQPKNLHCATESKKRAAYQIQKFQESDRDTSHINSAVSLLCISFTATSFKFLDTNTNLWLARLFIHVFMVYLMMKSVPQTTQHHQMTTGWQ
jgi:hypothetical protein